MTCQRRAVVVEVAVRGVFVNDDANPRVRLAARCVADGHLVGRLVRVASAVVVGLIAVGVAQGGVAGVEAGVVAVVIAGAVVRIRIGPSILH